MIRLKWGVIAGLIALVLSFTIGLISDANTFAVIMRALLFGVLFFGIGTGAWVLINTFFPDLLAAMYGKEEQDSFSDPGPGSMVDITLDNDNTSFAVPEMYKNSSNPDEIGSINDLLSGNTGAAAEKLEAAKTAKANIDQNAEDGYNDKDSEVLDEQSLVDLDALEAVSKRDGPDPDNGPQTAPVFVPRFEDETGDLGALPDLEAMSEAFSTNVFISPSEPDAFGKDFLLGKEESIRNEFSPKELAQGIKTVLTKDKL